MSGNVEICVFADQYSTKYNRTTKFSIQVCVKWSFGILDYSYWFKWSIYRWGREENSRTHTHFLR